MSLQLRQICLVARELAPAVADLQAVFGLERAFVDPGVAVFGLENTLLAVGRNFLEVVAPVREGTAAGRFLERRRGEGGYMVITQTPDERTQAECRRRAEASHVRVAWEHVEGSHHYMQLHPGDLQAAFLEIDWETHAELEGYWGAAGGRAWEAHVRTDVVRDFTGLALQAEDPPALARLWGEVAGLDVVDHEGHPTLELRNARIRFVEIGDGRGPGLSEIDLAVADPARVLAVAGERGLPVEGGAVTICGTRFRLG